WRRSHRGKRHEPLRDRRDPRRSRRPARPRRARPDGAFNARAARLKFPCSMWDGTMERNSAHPVAQLVQPARVHRSLYTDPEIFALELKRIFGAAWIYVGHESQVKNAGDYF